MGTFFYEDDGTAMPEVTFLQFKLVVERFAHYGYISSTIPGHADANAPSWTPWHNANWVWREAPSFQTSTILTCDLAQELLDAVYIDQVPLAEAVSEVGIAAAECYRLFAALTRSCLLHARLSANCFSGRPRRVGTDHSQIFGLGCP